MRGGNGGKDNFKGIEGKKGRLRYQDHLKRLCSSNREHRHGEKRNDEMLLRIVAVVA